MDLGNEKIDFDGVKLQYNLEAEQSVLGSILIDSSCLNKVIQILNHADYFYSANHKAIYSVMLEMFTMGQPVDYVTVLDKLKGVKLNEAEEMLFKNTYHTIWNKGPDILLAFFPSFLSITRTAPTKSLFDCIK